MDWTIKTWLLTTAFAIVLFIPSVYLHEYIHYRQTDCHIENGGRGFFQRMHWGKIDEDSSFWESAGAYMNASGCPSSTQGSEFGAYFWQFLFLGTATFIFSIVVGSRLMPEPEIEFKG